MMQSKVQDLFLKKMHDYGCAWRILRVSSLTDQILSRLSAYEPYKERTQRVDEGNFQSLLEF
ncbi:MAG: hypothetical protein CM15mP32_6630 [Flavobacteriaceae bacterium]|nr:MAG: hypothetical protein CM15mP32_6630 [Flavobacteriaceae bacterium]